MVPESHEIVLPGTQQLREFFKTDEFQTEVRKKLKTNTKWNLTVRNDDAQPIGRNSETTEERILLAYTRNNAGGLKDAIDFLVSCLIPSRLRCDDC